MTKPGYSPKMLTNPKQIAFWIAGPTWKSLKTLALLEDRKMSELFREAVDGYLKKRKVA